MQSYATFGDASTVVGHTTSGSEHTTSPSINRSTSSSSSAYGLLKLVALNGLVCGLEMCASAGFTYLPPMMLKTGFAETAMTFVVGIGPFLALTTVPVLGRWSDRCRRRKPFLIGIALLMVISLTILSSGDLIAHSDDFHLRAALLVTAVVILDYGCHAGFNPCEAIVADVMQHSHNKETGFAVYSTMVSVGGCIGYVITAVDWSPVASVFRPRVSHKDAHGQEQAAFSVILVMFVVCALTTILVAKDKAVVHRHDEFLIPAVEYPNTNHRSGASMEVPDPTYLEVTETSESNASSTLLLPPPPSSSKLVSVHSRNDDFSDVHRLLMDFWRLPLTLSAKFIYLTTRRLFFVFAAFYVEARSVLDVPEVMRRLFVADLCGWTALLCYYIFYTDYVGQAIYGGRPDENDALILYNNGIRMGCWGLLLHSITGKSTLMLPGTGIKVPAILYVNTLQKILIRTYGLGRTYIIGLAVFTASMMLTLMTNNLVLINMLAAVSGTGIAAVTSIPNMLVSAYHSDKATYFGTDRKGTSTIEAHDVDDGDNERGLASDLSILDSAYSLSQIVLSLSVGTIVDLTRSVSSYLIISAVFGIFACISYTRVVVPINVVPLK